MLLECLRYPFLCQQKTTEESNSSSEKDKENVVDKEVDVLAELARQESSETDTGENLPAEKTAEGGKEPDPSGWEAKRLASELEERRKREEQEKAQAEMPSSSTTFALSEKQTKIIGMVLVQYLSLVLRLQINVNLFPIGFVSSLVFSLELF